MGRTPTRTPLERAHARRAAPRIVVPASILLLIMGLLLVGAGCSAEDPTDADPTGEATIPGSTAQEAEAGAVTAPGRLSISQQAAQVLMVAFPPDAPDGFGGALAELMELGPPGGVILFGGNIGSPGELEDLVAKLQREAEHRGTGVPLLVAVDNEGGEVQRVREGVGELPGARRLAESMSPAQAGDAAREMGERLRGLGVNVNLAPVADVVRDPESFLYSRSYGADPESVASYVTATVAGYQTAGLIACVKHFPGHGAVGGDTHTETVEAQVPLEAWRDVHLVPFRAAVAAGVPMVMAAHLRAPAFDAINPASQSPALLGEVLREELGFQGVIVTDDLAMTAAGDPVSAALASLRAGADLLILSSPGDTQLAVHRAIVQAVEGGTLDGARLREAAARVLILKKRYGLLSG